MDKLLDVNKILEEYVLDIQEGVKTTATELADEGKEKLRNEFGTYKIRSGKYNKSWEVNVDDKYLSHIKCTIYVKKPHYRLTHLLEYGHATRDGGRTRAFPHIDPVAKYVEQEYEKRIQKLIQEAK